MRSRDLACLALAALTWLAPARAAGPDEVAPTAAAVHPLLVGATIPAVTVHDRAGKPVALRTLVAEKPTIFIFFRGGW